MTTLAAAKRERLQQGVVIPAHPLALDPHGRFDERHQRALTRYYLASGAGGMAVAVHTTQFAIRNPQIGLYRPVLEAAADVVREVGAQDHCLKIAGVVGDTVQALREAQWAAQLGYDLALVSLAGLGDWSDAQLLAHIQELTQVLPVMAFYLQPSVGGRPLGYAFWRALADVEGVVAIKIAPFNRYETLSVVRAVCESDRCDDIALYTGNDDHIVLDLFSEYRFAARGSVVTKRMVGALLGQCAVGTRRAVDFLQAMQIWLASGERDIPAEWMTLAHEWTDLNAALFDAANSFRGCIPGIHEVLVRQGLLASPRCLDPNECLSPSQHAEIDRVLLAYPHLLDDDFVRDHLDDWLH
ncbi:MAG: dihydrodipicolinate synthase family protein [Firmicutes bacterium]|nr:dihydrodipicolinate synthase family protein [Bacillota bacterium]